MCKEVMIKMNYSRGQAMVEFAILGSIVLVILGMLLSYLQRMDDQQYGQMESFRRALQKSNTYQGDESEGAGASVQLTMIEHRRQAALGTGFGKGSLSSTNSSANVFWAIPKVGAQPENQVIFRINDNEYKPEDDPKDFKGSDDIKSTVTSDFDETSRKIETPAQISNTRKSNLTETIEMTLMDKDNKPIELLDEKGEPVTGGVIKQGAYRDSTGQYRFNSGKVGNEIVREREWITKF